MYNLYIAEKKEKEIENKRKEEEKYRKYRKKYESKLLKNNHYYNRTITNNV
jgi:hypothetical protein